jgi:5-dehydro-2-deoxygluconokinase
VLGVRGEESVVVAPVPVDVINGLGAGDAFGGSLVHGLLSDWDLGRTLQFANAAGAIVAGEFLCADAMPTEDQVNTVLARGRV